MHSKTLTIISDKSFTTSVWFKDMILPIRKNAAEAKFSINELCFEEDNIDWSALPRVVIVATGSLNFIQYVLQKLKPYKKRVVLAGLDAQSFGADISCATPTRQSETNLLISYFHYHNRKDIALVGFRTDGINDMLRYQTATNTIAASGLPSIKDSSFFWDTSLTKCLENFIVSARKYNAAICPNDPVAIYLINTCNAHGIRIPEDLYVASFSNMQIGRYLKPSLTTVAMDFPSIGEQTFNVWNFLNEHIDSNITLRVHVPSTLVIRKSTDYMPEPPFDNSPSYINLFDTDYFSDTFYESPKIQSIMQIEDCISHRDSLDFKIISGLLSNQSYETLSEKLFISMGGIRYRVNKIYTDAGVATRADFVNLFNKHLGNIDTFSLENS